MTEENLNLFVDQPVNTSPAKPVEAKEPEQKFTLRPYQQEAVDKGLGFLKNENSKGHEFQILPTGSGKSLVIANIAKELAGNVLILQPSKEILEQNHKKLQSYGYNAAIYSASMNSKRVDHMTFATIGSIIRKTHLFKNFKYLLIDECHGVNAKAGDSMYNQFIQKVEGIKLLGFTATPYRLVSSRDYGSSLNFLNRTRPRIFTNVNYYIQNNVLFDAGYLAKLEYYSFNVIDRNMLPLNSNGTEFNDKALKAYYRKINLPQVTGYWANRLLDKRKNLLVFCSLIEEAQEVARAVPGAVVVTGDTEPSTRASILARFKSGFIKCVINVGVLTTGFDYPELETVLIARSTMSLALYYQIVGRAMRIHPQKESAYIVDLGGNINFFGKVETMKVCQTATGLYYISNNGRQLTNIPFSKS